MRGRGGQASRPASKENDGRSMLSQHSSVDPETPATKAMKKANVDFTIFRVDYEKQKTKTLSFSEQTGADEHSVVKTLVFCNEQTQEAFLLLMHGDYHVKNKAVALAIGACSANIVPPERAESLTGYLTGGISPFGTKTTLKVYMEQSIASLPRIYISGGQRGVVVCMDPIHIQKCFNPTLVNVGFRKQWKGPTDEEDIEFKIQDDTEGNETTPRDHNLHVIKTSCPKISESETDVQICSDDEEKARIVNLQSLPVHELQRLGELRRSQLEEVSVLQAVFDGDDELQLRFDFEAIQESVEDSLENQEREALLAVNAFPLFSYTLSLTIADNRTSSEKHANQALEAKMKFSVSIPADYPTDASPVLKIEEITSRDTKEKDNRKDRVVRNVVEFDESRLLRDMLSQVKEARPEVSIFGLTSWLQENIFCYTLDSPSTWTSQQTVPIHNQLVDDTVKEAHQNVGTVDNPIITTRCYGDIEVDFVKGEQVILGKPRTHIKLGLVGLPNVGKSSLFNLLSGLRVPAENYPFCTIDPNVATVAVPDRRFDHLCSLVGNDANVAPVIQITDIAGLVEGASKGAGLGNAFLHHISVCHVIFHIIRAFDDVEIEHVHGNVEPVRDIEIICRELRHKDLEAMEKRIADIDRPRAFQGHMVEKNRKEDLKILLKAREWLKQGRQLRHCRWTPAEALILGRLQMWTSKPAVWLVNMSAADFVNGTNPHIHAIRSWVSTNSPESAVIPVSVAHEQHMKKKAVEQELKEQQMAAKKAALQATVAAPTEEVAPAIPLDDTDYNECKDSTSKDEVSKQCFE